MNPHYSAAQPSVTALQFNLHLDSSPLAATFSGSDGDIAHRDFMNQE